MKNVFFTLVICFIFLIFSFSMSLADETKDTISIGNLPPKKETQVNGQNVQGEGGTSVEGAEGTVENTGAGFRFNGNTRKAETSTDNQAKGNVGLSIWDDGGMSGDADWMKTNRGAEARGVSDGEVSSEGWYDFGSVNSLVDGPFRVLNGEDVKRDETGLSVGSSDNVQQKGAVTNKVSDYSGNDNSFNVGSAESVYFDNSKFDNIKDSSFKVDDGEVVEANVTSSKDNNTVKAGNLQIDLNKDDNVKVVKNQTTGKYDVDVNSGNDTQPTNGTQPTVNVEDSYGRVACVNLDPGTRYEYTGEYDDFGLYVPSNADNFNLCIRTEAEEQYRTNCSQCGVMDFYNQSFVLNGNYEYERKDAVDPRLFTDVIKADGNFSGNLSENAEDITYLYPGLGQTFSSIFEVKYWQEDEGFRFASFNKL